MPPAPPLSVLDCTSSRTDFASVAFVQGPLDNANGSPIDSSLFDEDKLFDEWSGGSGFGCSNEGSPAALSIAFGSAFGIAPAFIFLKDLSVRPRNLVGFRAGVGPSQGSIAEEC